METSMRRKATLGLLAVTLAWGATFIWMKQAMNAIQPEIEAYGRTPVVAALVGGRFLIAFIALFVISKEARTALQNPQLWKGGSILGGILLAGFITQMIGLDSITPSTSAFLTSLYVVFTALITTKLTGQRVTRTMILGVALATFGAGFIEGPPHLIMGPWRNPHRHLCLFLCSSHSFHAKNHARNESDWCDEHIVPYRQSRQSIRDDCKC